MVQPKHVIFGTGAPQIVAAALDPFGAPVLPLEDWTQILDLRQDPDNQIVRRVTLWAHWNLVPGVDPPPDSNGVTVSVIDDTITDPTDAVLSVVANVLIPVNGRMPVKILDDYPMRGPVRMIAAAGPSVSNPASADNIVLFGYYTLAGEEGSRAMLDRRNFQIGSTVVVDGFNNTTLNEEPQEIHEVSSDYVDELTVDYVASGALAYLYFGETADLRYLILAPFNFLFLPAFDAIPMRGAGILSGEMLSGASLGYVTGYFTRY